ncbi:TonB family protein [Paucibacter sp. R3-3]|uniref:TonB family protein n=1 Tax=Roseateles agri TaxID=3098619 RepID=A0ABU5DQX9_9BURK|nr:TonB family protein [Paucibacter sp. R3-3]MDY0747674.1 TonB family protein [Paucibacter sp. R3-3]
MTALTSPPIAPAWFHPASARPRSLLRSPGGLASIGVHVLLAIGLISLAHQVRPVLEKARTIELTIERPPEPKPVEPPPPPPVKRLVDTPVPPKPAPTPPQPQPKTVDAPAAQAETYTPPPAPPATPVLPPPAPPPVAQAPAAPAPPKVIESAQIPAEYLNQVFAQINRSTAYPEAAKRRRQEGRVGYLLTLSQNGQLVHFEIVPSGTPALDEAAREAIKAAAPFPRLPELGGSLYLLSGAIVFRIT